MGPDTYNRLVIQQAEHDVTDLAIILPIVGSDQVKLIEHRDNRFKIQSSFLKCALTLGRIVLDFHVWNPHRKPDHVCA
ncbi:hypothetical protein EBBID32_15290 [Sphingobium indicum BiD32]|uniref:Uncharacterized protein n=1 Tax=Sphingobium indicum BiD32 TaxID=1301087 RepID=N1MJ24_9SPHN|nr:hypothetical protein EBBID32_15290 [Sphingobium indicum BiD32]